MRHWIVDRLPLIICCILLIIFCGICSAGLYLLIFQNNLIGILLLTAGLFLIVGFFKLLYQLTEAILMYFTCEN